MINAKERRIVEARIRDFICNSNNNCYVALHVVNGKLIARMEGDFSVDLLSKITNFLYRAEKLGSKESE